MWACNCRFNRMLDGKKLLTRGLGKAYRKSAKCTASGRLAALGSRCYIALMAAPHPRKLGKVARPLAAKTAKGSKVLNKNARTTNGVRRKRQALESGTYDTEGIKKLSAEVAEWQAQDVESAKRRSSLRRAQFESDSGIPIPDVLSPVQRAGETVEQLGLPGRFPFTRGVQPTMYRGRLWTMRQFAGFGTPADTNRRFKYLIEHGVTGLSTAFDMPALMGYDADHPMSRGEVGKEGVAVSSLRDFEILFDGIPLEQVTTSMTINASAIVALCMYIAVAEKQGVPMSKLGGTIQNDMLKEYIAQKEWIVPPRPAVRIVIDMIEFCARNMPKWHPVSISGYHIREAGATAVQELAFTLADGIGYVEECIKRGLNVDDFAPRLSFFWDVHNDFFEEVAKFRAARCIWARTMRARFGAKDPRSLHTNSLDETYALPTEEAVTLALRTQQIIAYESGVDRVVDPLAGSYYVEYLTDEMEKRALEYLTRIDQMGGIIRAVEQQFPQKEIGESAYRFQREVEQGERLIVGVNAFTADQQDEVNLLKIEERVTDEQVARLKEVRAERDQRAVEARLGEVEQAARSAENLMPPVLAAVKAYATLGEISDVFRRVWGQYREGGAF